MIVTPLLQLKSLDVNTLMIYLNGHKLPYASLRHPELIDHNHKNIHNEFLSDLLKYIKSQGIAVIAVITTTGHAGEFFKNNPDTKIAEQLDNDIEEQELIAFPEHIRKGKTSKVAGAAQLGFGVLCHNKLKSQQYAIDMVGEIIDFYGDHLDGVALHPPESLSPCICECCCKKFFNETSKDLRCEPSKIVREFFIVSYLKFQCNTLFPLLNKIKNRYIFTIPWLFQTVFAAIIDFVPKDITIIDWDYNLEDLRVQSIEERVAMYCSQGHKLIFMPTAGFSFNSVKSIDEQISAVHLQMKLAKSAGIDGLVQFLGPRNSKYLVETSYKRMEEVDPSYIFSYM